MNSTAEALTPDDVVLWERARTLLGKLSTAVPKQVTYWQRVGLSPSAVAAETRAAGQMVASTGDGILWPETGKSRRAPKDAEAFDALARGLAGLSLTPGGVDFLGQHFESQSWWEVADG